MGQFFGGKNERLVIVRQGLIEGLGEETALEAGGPKQSLLGERDALDGE